MKYIFEYVGILLSLGGAVLTIAEYHYPTLHLPIPGPYVIIAGLVTIVFCLIGDLNQTEEK